MTRIFLGILLSAVALTTSGCKDVPDRHPPVNIGHEQQTPSATVTLVVVRAEDGQRMALSDLSSLQLIAYVRSAPGDGGSRYEERFERELAAQEFADGTLHLPPGFYRFRHNSVYGRPPSGYYGQSGIVEVKPGQVTVVTVELAAAI